jgi:acyl-CoA thioesterase I
MGKKYIVAIFILISLTVFGISLSNNTTIRNVPNSGETIIAFGDSLIEGVGASDGGDLVSQISKGLGQPVINMGHRGDTTEAGLARVDTVTELKPKLVILLFGGNDFLRKVPKETTFKNIEQLITHIQKSGSAVHVLGIKGGVISDEYEEYLEEITKKYATGYSSNVLEGIIFKSELMHDTVHPNNAGYSIIAKRILPQIKSLVEKIEQK